MKILQVHKFFFLLGGSERVMFEEARLLKKEDHTIHHFAMAHPQNIRLMIASASSAISTAVFN